MSWRFQNRQRRARSSAYRLEELERRSLLSITAQAFSINVLQNTPSQIALSPYVQDSDSHATLTFAVASTTTTDGGQVSINAASGLVSYTPAANSPTSDSFSYDATDNDNDTSATETVTLNLASIAANPVEVEEVEGQSTIGLTILNLSGAIADASTKPAFTFSNVQIMSGGEGSVSLTNAKTGAFTFTPPSSTFTGNVQIGYQVTDGTGTNDSTVQIQVGPIAADPIEWGTLSSTNSNIPSTNVPSLVDRIHDVNLGQTFTFLNPIVAPGDGTVSNLNPATGSFTYTAPSSSFRGTASIQYTVTDGTNSTVGDGTIAVAPLVTQPVAVSELFNQSTVSLSILNLPSAVQDDSSNPTYTFSDLRVADGGGSVPTKGFSDASVGAFTYTLPSPASPSAVHIDYSVSDGTNTAHGVVTVQLVGIVANSASTSTLENQQSTLPALSGRIVDVKTSPTLTFSNPSVPNGDGTVAFIDTAKGILSYTPPNSAFTGVVPIQYKVSDGTYSTSGVLNLTVAPLITAPLLVPAALETQPTNVPSVVASGDVQDVNSNPAFTFSNPVIAPGNGTAQFTNTTTGALTYTLPSSSFFGVVQVGYTVADGAGNSTSGEIVINVEQTIQPKNDGPIAAVVGQPLIIPASQLLSNDIAAPNGLTRSIGSVGNAVNGTVVLNANGSVTFTPTSKGPASFAYIDTDAESDASTVATVTLNAKLGTTVYWANPADIVYGTPLSNAQLNATASVPGAFLYSPAPNTVLHAGYSQTLTVTFSPTDAADYAVTATTVLINVAQATTTVNWTNPADIVSGTPLSGAQLDATANVPGTFNYIPAAGTVLPAGNGQALTVYFTPFDATDYAGGIASVTINVGPAPPPGLSVQTHSFSGRVRHKVGGVIAQLFTSMAKLRTTYYSALVNWDDGVVQPVKLTKSGNHGFKVNATHTYRVAGSYTASVTISDPFGDLLTESFVVNVH